MPLMSEEDQDQPMMSSDDQEAQDHEGLMNHIALEMMESIERKDKAMFIDSLHTLIADIMSKMQPDQGEGEE